MPSFNSGVSRSAKGLAAGEQLLPGRASDCSEHEYVEDYTPAPSSSNGARLLSAGDNGGTTSYKPSSADRASSSKNVRQSEMQPFELRGGATLDIDGSPVFPAKDVKFGECTTSGAIMNYITAAIGVGIFALPGVYAEVGIVLGTTLLVAAFFASMVMCKLIGAEMDLARKLKIREALTNSIDTMDGVAKAALEGSKHQKWFVWVCLFVDNVDLLMTCTLFLAMSFPMLQKLLYMCKYGIMQGAYLILVNLVSSKVTDIDWADPNDRTLTSKPWGTIGGDGTNYQKTLCDEHIFRDDKLKFAKDLDYRTCTPRWETNAAFNTYIRGPPRWVVDITYAASGPHDEAGNLNQLERATLDVLREGKEVESWKWISVGITVLFLLATAFFKDMTALSKLSIIGVVGSAAAALFVTVASISEIAFNGKVGPDISWGFPRAGGEDGAGGTEASGAPWLGAIATGFSVIWFSYAVPVITPTVKSDMKKPSMFSTVAVWSHYAILALYLIVAFFGYFAFGSRRMGDGLHHVLVDASFNKERTFSDADWNAKLKAICQIIVEMGILANVIVTYPIFLNPVAITIEGLLTKAFLQCGRAKAEAEAPQATTTVVQGGSKVEPAENEEEKVQLLPSTSSTNTTPKIVEGIEYEGGGNKTVDNDDDDDADGEELKELSPCKDLLLRLVVRSILIGITVVLGTLLDLEQFMAVIGAVTAMYTCVYLPFIIHCVFYSRFWSKQPERVNMFVRETEMADQAEREGRKNGGIDQDLDQAQAAPEVVHNSATSTCSTSFARKSAQEETENAEDEKSEAERKFVEQMRGIRIYNEYSWWKWMVYIATVVLAFVVSVLTILSEIKVI